MRRVLSLLFTVDRRGGRVSGGPWADPDSSCHPPISRLARSRFAAFNQDFSYVLISRQLIIRTWMVLTLRRQLDREPMSPIHQLPIDRNSLGLPDP